MQIIGQKVSHQVFGSGVVTARGEGTLTVSFQAGEKMFLYPDAFSKFLSLQNSKMQGQILDGIRAREEEELRKEQAAEAQWEREAKLRNLRITARSMGVFDVTEEQQKKVFSQWKVSAGTYLSGLSKGEPRIPDRMKANSLCILTARPEGKPEAERKILGVFMADDTFTGSRALDGVIPAHPRYRMAFAPEEMPDFWPYENQDPAKRKWGNTSFKYTTAAVAQTILRDFRGRSKEAEDFYQYFCRINRLEADNR